MPDEVDWLTQNFADHVIRVVIAILSWKDNDAEFHDADFLLAKAES